ncbi:hypothetical protein [Sulfuriflexus sp.]|uniref:hypothetical protein n=1 Tax=Sulfuriflexus sp. TaxID=2015443 RepID=UPI0028CE9522|nr:hypothetical protein [Sulfuriflexus sp.]MDT8405507.1 hypothetical protein [Sulfuriflexus sp.]
MSASYRNLFWAGFIAVMFFLYYSQVATYWVGKEWVDPLIANFVIASAIFGFITFVGLRGELFGKVVFLVVMPAIPFLVLLLGHEGVLSEEGLGLVVFASMQLPYWVGGIVGGVFTSLARKLMTSNNRSRSGTAKSTRPIS